MSNLGRMAGLQPYQERMIEELRELQDRLAKLSRFLRHEGRNLELIDRDLLVAQQTHMAGYECILRGRVGRFTGEAIL